MKAFEVEGRGIFVPLVDKWDWVSTINKLKDRYNVIFLQGKDYAFIPYYEEINMKSVYFLLQAFKNDEITNVKELEI